MTNPQLPHGFSHHTLVHSPMDELNKMKEQLNLLHQKLNQERIVNDRLVRRVVNKNMSRINRDSFILTLVAAIAIPYCILVFRWMQVSWFFTIITAFFFLLALVFNIYTHRHLKPTDIANSTFAEVTRRVVRMKLLYARWLRFSIPFLIVWLVGFAYEITTLVEIGADERHGILIGGAIGGVIGAILGIITYRRTQRLANEILNEINDNTPN